jgi:hypothetical protein
VVVCASCGSDSASSPTVNATAATTVGDSTNAAPAATSASSSPTPGSSTASGDACADRDALASSVAALKDVDLRAEGTNGVTAAIDAVKNDLATLRGSLSAQLQPQAQAVQDAVDELETAVSNLGSGGAAAAATAVSSLATAAGTLLDSLKAGACGSSVPPTT